MDFAFTKEENAFRQEVVDFALQETPPGWVGPTFNDEEWEDEECFALGQKIAVKVAQKGWLTLTWPREQGGQARSTVEHAIFKEEIAFNRVPGVDVVGGGIVAPTLLAFGNNQQQKTPCLALRPAASSGVRLSASPALVPTWLRSSPRPWNATTIM